MTTWWRNMLRLRATFQVAVVFMVAFSATWVQTEDASATSPSTLTVADYVIRMAHAMGVQGHFGVGTAPEQYVTYLLQEGYINPTLDPIPALGGPLTYEIALELSRVTIPPAPAFLSEVYLTQTFLPASVEALGFVSAGEGDEQLLAIFAASDGLMGGQACPTPRRVRGDKGKRCPGPPP